MYEKHFSFKCKPFELLPDPDFLFPSATHKKAISYLDYGIMTRVGFILLSGEVGSGKTTIIRNLIKNLNGSIRLSKISYTKISSEQLIEMINKDFGLTVEGKSKTELLGDLNRFLIDQYAAGRQPLLLIDEAQNLTPDLLEEIRLLSNLETDKTKLIQVLLVGQPELKEALMLPELIQLRQRINITYHIDPLSLDETKQYIRHRTELAGNPEAIELTDDMLQTIHGFSRGIPRLINILCDFALLCAFTKGKEVVDFHIVKEVSKDLESNGYWNEAGGGRDSKNIIKENETAQRLEILEKTVKRHEAGSENLRDGIRRIEDMLARSGSHNEQRRISEVFERLIEKMVCRVMVKIADHDMMARLTERISKLKETSASEVKAVKCDNPEYDREDS